MTNSTTRALEHPPAPRPTAPLPPAAAPELARLELAFSSNPVVLEQRRIERVVSGLRVGESTVINGTQVTAVSLAVAEAITRYENASARTAELSALMDSRGLTDAEFDDLDFAQDTMRETRAQLAAAGMLHLIECSDEHGKTKPPLPVRPPRPHPHAEVVA